MNFGAKLREKQLTAKIKREDEESKARIAVIETREKGRMLMHSKIGIQEKEIQYKQKTKIC